jgi:hypothetical protein
MHAAPTNGDLMQECVRPQWASVCSDPTVTWNTPITQADWYSNSSHAYCPLFCLNPRRFNNSMYGFSSSLSSSITVLSVVCTLMVFGLNHTSAVSIFMSKCLRRYTHSCLLITPKYFVISSCAVCIAVCGICCTAISWIFWRLHSKHVTPTFWVPLMS